jgi:hypothetical protein
MERKKALRLAVLIAGVAAAVCAVSIIGFRQEAAATKAARRGTITPVLAGYVRPQASAAARIAPGSAAVGAKPLSVRVGETEVDPSRTFPGHKRYVIVGEEYLPTGEDVIPMGVLRAEGQ